MVDALGKAEHHLCLARCKNMGSCLLNIWSKNLLFPTVFAASWLDRAGTCGSSWIVHAPSPCSRICLSVHCQQVLTAAHWFGFCMAKLESICVFSDLSSGSLEFIPEPPALHQELHLKCSTGIPVACIFCVSPLLPCLLPSLCATH